MNLAAFLLPDRGLAMTTILIWGPEIYGKVGVISIILFDFLVDPDVEKGDRSSSKKSL